MKSRCGKPNQSIAFNNPPEKTIKLAVFPNSNPLAPNLPPLQEIPPSTQSKFQPLVASNQRGRECGNNTYEGEAYWKRSNNTHWDMRPMMAQLLPEQQINTRRQNKNEAMQILSLLLLSSLSLYWLLMLSSLTDPHLHRADNIPMTQAMQFANRSVVRSKQANFPG